MTAGATGARAPSGLEGVIAADTVLSHVDGERGVLLVRGRTLAELVERHGYEGTVALMWEGFVGSGLTRDGTAAALGAGRERAFARRDAWLAVAARQPLGEGLRVALAALPDDSAPADIAATFPVAIAALVRAHRGLAPVAPDPRLGTAADLLRMMAATPAAPRAAAALDAYITTVIDNGLSASTFTARIVASTRASLPSAILGAYCAFTGPLHGGAPGPTLDLLDGAAAAPDIDAWLDAKLNAGERLMGFGHRMFKVRDPRADVLRGALDKLGPDAGRLRFAADFERRALAALARFKPGRTLQSNVELNAALLLEAVGVPRDGFTPVFALARAAGWIAHAREQQATGRMIRPTARYVGPLPDGVAGPA
jgi:citrate synthase